jgi:hypothetical protein
MAALGRSSQSSDYAGDRPSGKADYDNVANVIANVTGYKLVK